MPRFRPRQRLRKKSEFDRVFRRGARLSGRLFTLIVAANGGELDRLGLAISRQVGGAVVRNRARRLLREGFRALSRGDRPALDLVVVGRPALAAAAASDVRREISDLVRRAEGRLGRARPARAD